jgi:hypothetical protein
MKLKCNDGIVRSFTISKIGGWCNAYLPVYCDGCGKNFGVHSTKIIKPILRAHICYTEKLEDGKPCPFIGNEAE